MKNLLSGSEVRWWLRSRKSGRLNSLSYWLCVLAFSAVLSLIFGALWQAREAEQSRLRREAEEAQARLRQASEEADWSGDAPLNALEPYREAFLDRRKNMIHHVRSGEPPQGADDFLLRPAGNIKNKDKSNPKPSLMFGNPDVRVYPSFATFSPAPGSKGLTDAEKAVFNNFAAFVTSLYESHKDGGGTSNVERSLAEAFGLNDPRAGAAPLDVPWLYVASREGAIAVFPGATVINNKDSWNTTSRPWFRGALGGEAQFFTKGLLEEDLLSLLYLDQLAERTMHVRTYMYKFHFAEQGTTPGREGGSQDFVICIDIFRDPKRARERTLSAALAPGGGTVTAVKASLLPGLPPGEPGLVQLLAFGLAVLFFTAVRWVSTTRDSQLTFTRARSLLGRIHVEDGLKLQNDDLVMTEDSLGIEFGKYARGKVERGRQEKHNVVTHISVGKSRTDLRGCELWEVSRNVSTAWSIFGIKFKSDRVTPVGTIRLIYTSEVLPDADWVSFNARAFSEIEAAELQPTLLKLLERNADSCEGSFPVMERGADAAAPLHAPKVPDRVRAVVSAKELLAVRQQRAYVRLTSERLGELYSEARVKAVMASGYFEDLLDNDHFDFLLKGKTISRIVAFPDEAAEFELSHGARSGLARLLGGYSPASARRLQRVILPAHTQSEPSPVYDFAILDDSCVIVAHLISKVVGVDRALGKPTQSTYVVEGYVSWRPADVEFYRGLFAELAAQAKALTLPADRPGIAGESSPLFDAAPDWA